MFGLFKKKKKKQTQVEKVETKKVEVKEEPILEEEVVEVEAVKEEVKEEPVKRKRKAINHITKHKSGGWQVKKEGAQRAQKRFDTQKEAIEFAKSLEKTTGTSFIIHKADGSTRKKTY